MEAAAEECCGFCRLSDTRALRSVHKHECHELNRKQVGLCAMDRKAHLLVYIHMLEAHPLDGHKVRSEEATARTHRAPQRRSRSAAKRRPHLRLRGTTEELAWRRSAKVVPADRESIFYLSAALVSVSIPSGYHMMPSPHSFPESYVV